MPAADRIGVPGFVGLMSDPAACTRDKISPFHYVSDVLYGVDAGVDRAVCLFLFGREFRRAMAHAVVPMMLVDDAALACQIM